MISEQRLHQLLAAYGAEPQRWPAGEREQARALLQNSPAARRAWEQACSLDDWLEQAARPVPPPELERRLINAVNRRVASPWTWLKNWLWGESLPQHLWRPALTLGLPLLLGLGLGGYLWPEFRTWENEAHLEYTAELVEDAYAPLWSEDENLEQGELPEWL